MQINRLFFVRGGLLLMPLLSACQSFGGYGAGDTPAQQGITYQAAVPVYVELAQPGGAAEAVPPPGAAPAFRQPTASDQEQQRTAERLAAMRNEGLQAPDSPTPITAPAATIISDSSVPAGLPPLPAGARSGQCYALVRIPAAPTTRYVASEPVYQSVTERVQLQPARQVWKPGRGAAERIDHATGQIMCLVEEPAQYQTVTRQVVKQQPQMREIVVPAPAGSGTLEWRPVLCETNSTARLAQRVQVALKRQGYDPGPIDGRIGARTIAAMNRFQRARSLRQDNQINYETVQALGVAL